MELPSVLPKYKIVSETFCCDGISNALVVERRYKLFRFGHPNKRLPDFYELDGKEFTSDGIKCVVNALGWGDCNCKTFDMMYTIVPNSGKVFYNEDNIRLVKEPT